MTLPALQLQQLGTDASDPLRKQSSKISTDVQALAHTLYPSRHPAHRNICKRRVELGPGVVDDTADIERMHELPPSVQAALAPKKADAPK